MIAAELKSGTLRLADFLALDRVLLALRRRSRAVLCLNLHRVSPEAKSYWPPLHPDLFDQLLAFLRAHCGFTTFRRLGQDADTTTSWPLVILSFDDGYLDFLTEAAPIMERHGVPANLNVVPECVQTGQPPLNVRLYDYLEAVPASLIRDLARQRLGLDIDPRAPAARQRLGAALSRDLKSRTPEESRATWEELRESLSGFDVASPTSMMSLDDVKAVASSYELGAHSFAHDSMEYVTDEYFVDDVRRCRRWFRDSLGSELDIYAFPNGSYRESQIDLARNEGIEHVLLVGERPSAVGRRAHTRLTIGAAALPEIKLQALGYRARWWQ